MLSVENVVKRFGDHVALDGVSMDVPKGKIFGLLGPNGAGKTTLIRIITRITGPDSGRVLLNGRPMTDADVAAMGYLPEERGLYKKMKVGEQALYLAQLKGMDKQEATKRLKEWFERWEMGNWWNKKVEELSKGMAQKVQFVTTVLHQPEFLILDEPFSGFDPINAELIRTEILRLAATGTTIMLSTHNMGSVEELCDHIALIDRNHVVLSGSVKQIRQQYSTNTYRVEFKGQAVAFANALAYHGELLDHQEEEGICTARVKLLHGATLNNVLAATLPVAQMIGLREEVPGMHEIFIRAVSEKNPDLVAAGTTE
ncbi:MAG TPA: ABC transporter ATP-binding protein [Flavobacteriales bacterium]|nr:ABC transporter ATP-binding protein [Flavobacteriales bacterium]HRO40305.1 ABC transporter ATP-binding protein [Flavobacteriales bacterium]HRP82480.1 ABC transporter ATP-binding protein [Flavobacteriales bacterium]HRQ84076.1 ABC transporter ATP-binding protein [Flavobacteriales bacterium]